jgi:hypothetical protein
MPLESVEEREARRDREWVRRMLNHPKIRSRRDLTLEAAATLIGQSPQCLLDAIECGMLTAQRVPPNGDFMFTRGELMDFLGWRPLLQVVLSEPAPEDSSAT